jgi:hypothetical protein
MKIQLLAITLASAFLTACATQPPSSAPNADAFLQPTVIEGPYKTLDELLADPSTTTRSLIDFGGAGEDANQRCNADKASALTILHGGNP